MKIDKTNPAHWLCLILFGVNVLGAMLLRPFCKHGQRKIVMLYGHKLCGNLLAIHQYWREHDLAAFDMVFLTMDKAYHRKLLSQGVACVLATRPKAMMLLSRVDAVVSDHGLHVMSWMVGRSDIKFFDVWHGIPFKGFDVDDFRLQHQYDEIWVASPLMQKMYVERYGFNANMIKVTGYARTDRLVHQDADIVAVKRQLDLDGPDVGKIVLFAPTWKQDAVRRSIYPFGVDEQTFLQKLSALAVRTSSTVVVRAHLNSDITIGDSWERVVQRPFASYPDTESLLLVSDVLVCDWSSIAFDYLLLERPTLFLDVEPPFAMGFTLGPECRFGEVVENLDDLMHGVESGLHNPEKYDAKYGADARKIREEVYGSHADGKAAERCVSCLNTWLG